MIYSLILITSTAVFADWSYDDTTTWVTDYPLCGGTTQSPINIDTSNGLDSTSKSSASLDWKLKDIEKFTVTNNGHTLKMIPVSDGASSDNDNFGVLQNIDQVGSEHSEYCLDSIHIHWGDSNTVGSEHTIDGTQYAMEMHFVHYSCDYNNLDAATADSPNDPYVLAVVGVLFTVGDENDFIKEIVSSISSGSLITHDTSKSIEADMTKAVPDDDSTRNFYFYKGSLTTPSCDPIVRWHLLKDTMTISSDQLTTLRSVKNHESKSMAPNYRPTQSNSNTCYYV